MKKKLFAVIASAVTSASAVCTFALTAFAEEAAASDNANQATGGSSMLTFVVPLIFMFVLLYFMAIRPQKKREQEAKEMQENLQVGDEVITSGGIVGMIFRIGDDTVVIETGGERHKLRIKKWAIAENVSAAERVKAAQSKTKTSLAAAAVNDSDSDKKKSKKSKKSEEAESSDKE